MLNGVVIAVLTTVLVLIIGIVLESIRPVGRKIAKTVGFNLVYAAAFVAWSSLLQPIADAESAFLHRRLGVAPIRLPLDGWRVIISAMVLIVAEDFIFYWVHRAQHRYHWLWAMHSFHHSDDDVNVATSHRHYWLEKPISLLLFYMPLGLVFRISPQAAALYSALFLFFAAFPHMNIRIELGFLTPVFLGPQVHRLHHSVDPRDYNSNFAGAFPVWDILFGTYRAPKNGEFPMTGVPEMEARPGTLHTILWPVQRIFTDPNKGRNVSRRVNDDAELRPTATI